jgi:hypothetical protein
MLTEIMSTENIVEKFEQLHVDLETIPRPGGSYAAVNVRENIAYVAIQFPIKNDEFYFTGRLGNDVSTQQGYEAARLYNYLKKSLH